MTSTVFHSIIVLVVTAILSSMLLSTEASIVRLRSTPNRSNNSRTILSVLLRHHNISSASTTQSPHTLSKTITSLQPISMTSLLPITTPQPSLPNSLKPLLSNRTNTLQMRLDQLVLRRDVNAITAFIRQFTGQPRRRNTHSSRYRLKTSPRLNNIAFHLMSMQQTYQSISCTVQTEFFCSQDILGYRRDVEVAIMPKLHPITFCPQERCSCSQIDDICLPLNGTMYQAMFLVLSNMTSSSRGLPFERLVLPNVTECRCQPKCRDRHCIHPFKKTSMAIDPDSDCHCVCDLDNLQGDALKERQRECKDIVEGNQTLSSSDCFLTGRCLLPPCVHGSMSPFDIAKNRCPPPK